MMPVKIAPSILAADLLHFSDELEALAQGGADYIHFDVMDGAFVPELSFGELLLRQMKASCGIPADVHLMVREPEKNLQSFIHAGADRITVHLEATSKLREILDTLHEEKIPAGISICPETPVEDVFPYLPEVESILVMTVHPGFGGQHFMEESLLRIRALREEIERRKLSVSIAVDGGIRTESAVRCRKAGADFFICGTFVFENDRAENIRGLRALLEECGS